MFLLKMLGIKQAFVAVNKMDAVDYKKERFETVKKQISELLDSFDYRTEELLFIPVSAMEGDNIYHRGEGMEWYRGPTLIEALDEVRVSEEEKPLRFAVQDVYEIKGEKTIAGRVESGMLRRGDEMVFDPSGAEGKIEELKVFGGELKEARAGDSIGVIINDEGVRRGDVGGLIGDPPKHTKEFFGEAVLLGKELKKGETLELRCGTAKVGCKIKEIKEKIDSETGEVMERNPEEMNEHDAATIAFATEPLVVEKFVEIPELGKFVLVKNSKNIGADVVLQSNFKKV